MNTEQPSYKSIIDHLPQMVCRFDRNMCLTFTNLAYQRWRGQSEAALLGSNVFDNIPQEQQSKVRAHIANLTVTQPTAVSIHESVLPNGQTYWIEWQDCIIVDNQGEIIGYQGVGRDVTQEQLVAKQLEQAQLELKRSEEQHRIISELVSDYASEIRLDDQGNPVRKMWLGSDIQEMLGYTGEEDPLPQDLARGLSYYHPDDQPRLQQSVAQTLAGAETSGEYRMRAKDDSYIWFFHRRKPLWDESGERVTGYLLAMKNITAEKNAEIALRQSEERYRLVSGLMSDSAHHFERAENGEIKLSWTLGTQTDKALGWPEGSLSDAEAIHRIIHPDDVKQVQESIERTLEGYETLNQYRIRNVQGSYLWYSVHRRPIWNLQQSQVIAFIVAMKDITLAKRAEEALRQANQELEQRVAARTASLEKIKNQLEAIFNNSGDSILLLDETFKMIEANETCNSLFNRGRYLYLGSPFTQHLTAADTAIFQQAITAVSQTDTVQQIELSLLRRPKTAKTVDIEVSISQIFDAYDDTKGYILNIRDISTRKQTAQALRTALETEQEVSHLKTRIISVASHEFRTPLTAILTTAETLQLFRSRLSEKSINERLSTIIDQVEHLGHITEDMLQLTRLEAQTNPINLVPYDIDQFCKTIVEGFYTQEKYHGRIDYQCIISNKIASIDQHLMNQAISNLVQNGLKYSDPSSKVQLRLTRQQNQLHIAVADQGIGIPKSDLKRLFTPFNRASNVGAISGTGLGLSIAQRAIETHGGRIEVDTQVGEGSTFTIIIPTS